jgi:hypothetical protein
MSGEPRIRPRVPPARDPTKLTVGCLEHRFGTRTMARLHAVQKGYEIRRLFHVIPEKKRSATIPGRAPAA